MLRLIQYLATHVGNMVIRNRVGAQIIPYVFNPLLEKYLENTKYTLKCVKCTNGWQKKTGTVNLHLNTL